MSGERDRCPYVHTALGRCVLERGHGDDGQPDHLWEAKSVEAALSARAESAERRLRALQEAVEDYCAKRRTIGHSLRAALAASKEESR